MYPELLNLLPPERIRAFRREYFMRLAVVAIYALIGVVVGSGALLVPSYLYVNQEVQARQARSTVLDTELAASNGQQTNQRLATFADTASYLSRLATTTTATAALQGVLAVSRQGVTLMAFTFTPPAQGAPGKMTLSGTATTREMLQAYTVALGRLPFVSNVDLPISAYAKDANIPFLITLTGTFLP
jgi:Tfp pilus assembly protein PilN